MLFRLLTLPYVRKHLPRTLLTVLGIVLGVAVFVGMHTANQSVSGAFSKTVDRIAGATQLQITSGENGFPEEILEKVQSLPEVRTAVPVIEAILNPNLASKSNMLVLAVDMTGDRSLRDYDLEDADAAVMEDPLVFLAQPDSLMVSQEFAEENRLKINDRVTLQAIDGPRQFVVRGIMKSSGLASAFGGNLAIMDVYAAQKMFGRGRRFDRIDLAVQDSTTPDAVRALLEQRLGPGYRVESPASRGKQFESLSSVYGMLANITSLFALFIGMFIIYNSFAIAVTQRRKEIGILRALGATRGQIQRLFLAESAVLGLVGALGGVAFGILIARAIAGGLGDFLAEIYGVGAKAEEISSNPLLLGFALFLGVLTSLIAAWVPAKSAASVDPVHALQKGKYQILSAGELRTRKIATFVLLFLVGLTILYSHERLIFYAGYLMAILSGVMIAPTLSNHVAKALRPLFRFLRPVEGTLAADSLLQAPRRTSGAVTALALSVALVVAISGMTLAAYRSIEEWIRISLNPDMYLSPTQTITDRSFRFPLAVAEQTRALPGVRLAQLVRSGRVEIEGELTMLVTLEIASLSTATHLPAVQGDPQRMYQQAAAGQGVIVSDTFSMQHGKNLGDQVTIQSPSGALKLPVLGVVIDYSDQKGSVLMDRALYVRHWQDDSVNVIRLYLQPGVTPDLMRQRIAAAFDGKVRYFIFSNEEIRRYILQITDQWFALTYSQIAVAVLVAILGIINTLTVSITDRRRELGVLQAVGALRNQVRATIWLEAVAIAAVGLVLGFAFGAVALYYSLETSVRDLGGVRLQYTYPFANALLLVPVILSAAFLAALGPAESAVRGSLVEALEYE